MNNSAELRRKTHQCQGKVDSFPVWLTVGLLRLTSLVVRLTIGDVDNGQPSRAEQIRRFILENVEAHPREIAALAGRRFGVTRQAVHKQIRALVQEGLLVTDGHTSGTTYRRADRRRQWTLNAEGLSEHVVWAANVRPMLEGIPENVLSICEYGVTEMLNNVIDHSKSTIVSIQVERSQANIAIGISDLGLGIFNKIQRECGLDDARHAVFELTKGKLTTDPERHTGEGVFFTSRVFDKFSILSGGLLLSHNRDSADWIIGDKHEQRAGTLVGLEISPASSHTTQEVFDRYSTEQDDYAFSKTHVGVRLADVADRLVSRSQAKRIVARLERFKEVILDFSGVAEIGPAFADEVFRVFPRQYPATRLLPIQANEQVAKMIRRAEAHHRFDGGSPAAQEDR